ncbi:hypothetical protein TrCOL_g5963 [Triparma columacea]|uniref:Acyl-CoA thioesterase-like N-terminal HotDog domain-containing protein n=1 Tax=Triparma columacea TaxID=722753 RepID=A0A9W7GJN7_9STRA|nr:hypothetical protein TrCOL_g5963 [Triparma columacea]
MLRFRVISLLGRPSRIRSASSFHPKLSLEQVSDDTFKCSKENLNVVFAPGAFGGQLMAQSLTSAQSSSPPSFSPSSQQCSFLGPTLIDSPVYFTVSPVRDSGRSFKTLRVRVRQLGDESSDLSSLPLRPVSFESTVSLYSPPSSLSGSPALSPSSSSPPLTLADFTSSLPLSSLSGTAGSLFATALTMTSSLSLPALSATIRVPTTPLPPGGLTSYFVGVPNTMSSIGAGYPILPYLSDGMTQVLACCRSLDDHWSSWPEKLTVWNYSTSFSPSVAGSPYVDDGGLRWYVLSYDFQGVHLGLGSGSVRVYDLGGEGVLCHSTFLVIAHPPKDGDGGGGGGGGGGA